MFSSFSILAIGFVLGMRHATDPDHVVAVTTIVTDQPSLRHATVVGALWGLGHSVTIVLVGGVLVVFRVAVPARLGLAMEFAVAVMLIVLGAANLVGQRNSAAGSARATARPMVVGFIHGLAGSAFVALLVLAAVPSPWLGLMYLALFGVGTVGGMMLITAAIAAPSAMTARRFGHAQRYLRLASGVASVVFGLFLAQRGIADGLFSSLAQWTPR